MSLGVLFAVLTAALIHATWNAVIKTGADRYQGMLLLTLTQGVMALAMVFWFPLPAREAWPWLLGSGFFHTFYKLFLSAAYQRGDLSRVYPIARGAAPVMVLAIGWSLATDVIFPLEIAGILLVSGGILLLAHGVWNSGETRSLVPFALGSAACTAGYSIVDGLGARVSGTASGYVAWLFVLDAAFFTVCSLVSGRKAAFVATPKQWMIGALVGGLSLAGYWIVVWAMTQAPIALVSALRETSVLFAMGIGVVLMGEKFGLGKGIAALLIVGGIVAIRL